MKRRAALLALAFCAACQATPEGSMSLPTSRNRTYSGITNVHSGDLNDIQDAIVDQWKPSHWRWFAFGRAPVETNIAFDSGGGGVYDGGIRATADVAEIDGLPLIGLPEGVRPTAVAAYVNGTGAAQEVHVNLFKSGITGAVTLLGELQIVNPAVGDNLYTLNPLTTVAALVTGERLILQVTIGLNNTRVRGVGVQFDKLP